MAPAALRLVEGSSMDKSKALDAALRRRGALVRTGSHTGRPCTGKGAFDARRDTSAGLSEGRSRGCEQLE